MSMSIDRHTLITLLDALEMALPDMLRRNSGEGDFWAEFAGEADQIIEQAGGEDSEFVRGRIDCMLRNAGMIPGEDEGSPCG